MPRQLTEEDRIAAELAETFGDPAQYDAAFNALLGKFGEVFAMRVDQTADLIAAELEADLRALEDE